MICAKLLVDVPAFGGRNGHVLRSRRSPSARRPQARVHLPLRVAHRWEDSIRTQDSVHVRLTFVLHVSFCWSNNKKLTSTTNSFVFAPKTDLWGCYS